MDEIRELEEKIATVRESLRQLQAAKPTQDLRRWTIDEGIAECRVLIFTYEQQLSKLRAN